MVPLVLLLASGGGDRTGDRRAALWGWFFGLVTWLAAMPWIVPTLMVFRALPRLKEELQMNVEIASPAHFIPELPGWQERSLFIAREGRLSFYHYDPYAQALAKIERGHSKDLADVNELIAQGLVEPARLRELYDAIEPRLHRFPAIDPPSFRRRLEEILDRR